MKLKLIIILLASLISFSQNKVTISGTLKDEHSTETLIGVNIYIP